MLMGAGKRVFVLLVLAAVLSGIFLMYSSTANVVSDKIKINIGVSLPLTGAASHLGGWALQGMEIAKDEDVLEYSIQDDQCQGQAAVNSFNALKENRFILGPLCNAASIPASKLAEEYHVVMITVGVSTRAIREAGDFSFTILPSIGLQTKALAEHMEDNGIGSVSVVYVNDEYGVENKETFEKVRREFMKLV